MKKQMTPNPPAFTFSNKAVSENTFSDDETTLRGETHQDACEVITHLLIWVAGGSTIEQRGVRATVALYCLRPDLIGDATLEQIGEQGDCTRQTIHKLAKDFRNNMGLAS